MRSARGFTLVEVLVVVGADGSFELVEDDGSLERADLPTVRTPIAWVPYFRHPDPSEKRKTGFLLPRIINSNTLGLGIQVPSAWPVHERPISRTSFCTMQAWAGFNGYQAATMNWQSMSTIAFAFRVTPRLLAQGLAYALVLGLLGGLLPAIRAARLPVVVALREL